MLPVVDDTDNIIWGGGGEVYSFTPYCIVASEIIKTKITNQIREHHGAQYLDCSKSRPTILLYQTKIGMTKYYILAKYLMLNELQYVLRTTNMV